MARPKKNTRRTAAVNQPSAQPTTVVRIVRWGLALLLIVTLLGVACVGAMFWYFGRDLPQILKREDFNPPQMSRVYASNDELIAEWFQDGGRRTVISLDAIPPMVRHAFMAAEDADFLVHSGIDYRGLVRAVYNALRHDTGMRGTSTITQQVVKNLLLTPERSLDRKIKEIILSRELEKNLSKDDILYLYLNMIYLGHGNVGIEEAARFYFGKSVGELKIEEAAMIAGLTQGPESRTPLRFPDRAKQRRDYVLDQMWKKGFITEAAYRASHQTPIELANREAVYPHLGKAPYFVEHIRRELIEKVGEEKIYGGGLRIYTTVNLVHQEGAERAVHKALTDYDERYKFYRPVRQLKGEQIEAFLKKKENQVVGELAPGKTIEAVVVKVSDDPERVELRLGGREALLDLEPRGRIFAGRDEATISKVLARGDVVRVQLWNAAGADGGLPVMRFESGPEAASVVMDPTTREVTAMVGGFSFVYNQYNSATQARRQSGSAFKPLVYAAAIEEKVITPATIYLDSPSVFAMSDGKTWSPKNSDGTWRGAIRVREALGASRNVVSVRVLEDLGISKAIAFARRLGIRSPLVENNTLVMGSSEIPMMELTNAYATLAAQGNYGEPRVLRRVESVHGEREMYQTQLEQVVSPEVAYLATSLLTSAVEGFVDREGQRRGGTGGVVRAIGHPVAGKTGTTNDARDAWFLGYTAYYVGAAWVGFADNRSLGAKEYGGRVAAPIWRDMMQEAHSGKGVERFGMPSSGVTTANIDPATGKLMATGGVEEVFLVGTAPTDFAPVAEEATEESFLFDQFEAEAEALAPEAVPAAPAPAPEPEPEPEIAD